MHEAIPFIHFLMRIHHVVRGSLNTETQIHAYIT